MGRKKSVRDVDVSGLRVLVRCDFNVPLKGTAITDDNRIVEALPTIRYLLDAGARVVLCSHLGRPKGYDAALSLAPVAWRLGELLEMPVPLAADCVGDSAQSVVAALKNGQVCLLENLRFHPEEEAGDAEFSAQLASLADLYVNDAFGTAHRAHASTTVVADYLPAVSGFLIEKELYNLGGLLDNPAKPFVAVLGGNKISDKIGVIENLLGKVDALVIGGGMAFTFLEAMGANIGSSVCEREKLGLAIELLNRAKRNFVAVHLPEDVLCGAGVDDNTAQVAPADDIPEGMMGLDIGPQTVQRFTQVLAGAKTIFWNGPMGVFENPAFRLGTAAVAEALACSPAATVIGGGDSAAAAAQMGFADRITHISTGGGASLEYLEGIELPGIACLLDA